MSETVVTVNFDRPHCLSCLRGHRLRRGLCDSCYVRHQKLGTLNIWPKRNRTIEDTAEDYAWLRSQGWDDQDIAKRLGMKLDSLQQALRRAQRKAEAA